MNNHWLDKAGTPRADDIPDIEKLQAYLNPLLDLQNRPLVVKQFKGGASNLTFLLQSEEKEWILRTSPVGTKASGAHDMWREFHIQQKLYQHLPVPEMIHFCNDPDVIGRDFYIMEKISGVIPRKNLPKDWLKSGIQIKALCLASIDLLAKIHTLDYKSVGLNDLYKGEGYVERQVNGWISRYKKAQTPDMPTYEAIMQWLQNHQPKDHTPCLIHNDFRFDNLVFDPKDASKIIGILDWEMATIGDPFMELGNSLAYWVQANDPLALKLLRRQPTHLPGMFSRQGFVDYYQNKTGNYSDQMIFYYLFGLFRLAVIVQQIYFRLYHKQTRNKSFAVFGPANQLLHELCTRLIHKPDFRIDRMGLPFHKDLFYAASIALKTLGSM